MAALEYTIKLENLTAVGATCSDFNITWDDTLACGNITCVIKDNEITVQIPEECRGECIEAVIECTEPCTNCTPQRVTICPCETNADCDSCSSCVDNLCVSICDADEFCEDGQCKECNDSTPCPDDKVCVNGECVCPAGLFLNDKGQCVPCLPENTPNCFICTPDGLIPVECVDGVCDPETGDCVDCIGGGDCEPNEKCLDGDCVCKDGFVRNPVTGECEPAPECDNDSDCPACEQCNQYGFCEPIECPEGQVCVDGECKTPCENGVDCPDGYGCNPDTGFCEKCEDQDCSTPNCEKLLGCECSNNQCVDADNCNQERCNNTFDCPEGCVCYQGQCVDCSNFACADCNVPGCECVSGTCQDDPNYECGDKVEIVKVDNECNLRGEATIQDGCACDPITLTFKAVSKVSENTNSVNLDFLFEARKGLATTFGEAQSLSRLDNTNKSDIADNDVPDTGSVRFRQVISLVELDSNNNPIAGTQTTETIFDLAVSFNSVAFVEIDNRPIYKKGAVYVLSGANHRITNVRLEVVQDDNFDFTSGSGCVYDASNVLGDIVVSDSVYTNLANSVFVNLNRFVTIFSDDVRNPMFKWYRNTPSAASYDETSDIFRKVYKPAVSSGFYTDTLFGPDEIPALGNTDLESPEGELWSLYGYALRVDCACGDNYDDYGKAKFCQPDSVTADFNTCNTTMSIDGFTVCDVNQDIAQFTGVPNNAQVYFELYINGSLYRTYQHDQSTGLVQSATGDEITELIEYGSEITSAKLVQRTSAGIICEQRISVPTFTERQVDINEPNCDADDRYIITIPENQTPSDIDRIIGWSAASGGVFTKSFDKGTENTFTIVFDDGCRKEITVAPDCCSARVVTANDIEAIDDVAATLPFSVSNMQFPISYVLQPPTGSSITGSFASTDALIISIPNPVDGVYNLSVNDAQDCDTNVSVDVTVSVPEPPVVTVLGCSDFFEGETKTITLRVNADAIGGVLNYTNTNLSVGSFPTTEESIIFDVAEKTITTDRSTSFEFLSFEKDGNTYSVGQSCQVNEVSTPVVTSVTAAPDAVCLGDSFELTVQGTAGATVTISNGVGEITLDSNGQGVVSITPSTVGTKTYTATRIVFGAYNEVIASPSETVIVSNAPTISATADCESNNPSSNRVITIEVDDSGGALVATNFNTGDSLAVTGGSNGDGTSTYEVTLPSSTTVQTVEAVYTNALGCAVSTVQGVPVNCDCPAVDTNVTADSVCVGTGDDITFQITSVVVENTTYTGAQFNVEWFDIDGNSLSTSNPYLLDTTGLPVGAVQLRYDVTIVTGEHNGCTDTGFVSGSVLAAQQTLISSDGTTGNFDGTLCDGGSVGLFSTLEGSAYEWRIDGGAIAGTSRTFTFNEGAQVAPYEVSLVVTDANGCSATATRDIFVGTCDCNVQYVDVQNLESTFGSLETSDGRLVNAGSTMSSGCFSTDPTGAATNDVVQAEIETMLTALGEAGAAEVFWQYLEDDCTTRFYVLGSSITLNKLTFSAGAVNYDYLFTQACNATTAPGCTTATADNYQAGLIGNSTGITITDDGSCFQQYYTALFATDLVGISGNEDVSVVFDGGAPSAIAGAAATPTVIGSFTYNTYLADQINGLGIDLVAAYPTASELNNDPAGLGANVDYCTSRVEYIRLYWPVGTTFSIDATSGSFSDAQVTNANSYTVKKCSGGASTYLNIAPIGLQTIDANDVP
jgi:hypothetical protein